MNVFNIQLKQIYKKKRAMKIKAVKFMFKKTNNHKYIFITVMKPEVDAAMLVYNKTWRLE